MVELVGLVKNHSIVHADLVLLEKCVKVRTKILKVFLDLHNTDYSLRIYILETWSRTPIVGTYHLQSILT